MAIRERILLNGVRGTLSSGVDDVETTFDVDDLIGDVNILDGINNYAILAVDPENILGPEWVEILAAPDGNGEFLVNRGANGSTARSHISGVKIRSIILSSDAVNGIVDRPWAGDTTYDYEFESAPVTTIPTGWGWVNQEDATYAEGSGIGTIIHPDNNGVDLRILTRSINPAASFEWRAKISQTANLIASGVLVSGLVLRESGTGKLVLFFVSDVNGLSVQTWTNPNVFGASVASLTGRFSLPLYLRIIKTSSTSWAYYFSSTGSYGSFHPVTVGHNVAAFMTSTGPDQFGIFGQNANGDGKTSCFWFRSRSLV
jgi:hypothetical protein